MGTPNRKASWSLTASLAQLMGSWTAREPTPKEEEKYYPVGNFFADYSQPTREEIDTVDPDVDKLFSESQEISEKK